MSVLGAPNSWPAPESTDPRAPFPRRRCVLAGRPEQSRARVVCAAERTLDGEDDRPSIDGEGKGLVSLYRDTTPSASRERSRGRHKSCTPWRLDAAPGSPFWFCRTKRWGSLQGFVLADSFWLVLTKARLVESCGGLIPPAIYSVGYSPDHDSLFNLPAWCREAKCPFKASIPTGGPRTAPGYLACEPAASGSAELAS